MKNGIEINITNKLIVNLTMMSILKIILNELIAIQIWLLQEFFESIAFKIYHLQIYKSVFDLTKQIKTV